MESDAQGLRRRMEELQAAIQAKVATCHALEAINGQLLAAIGSNTEHQLGIGIMLQQDLRSKYFTVISVSPTGPAAHHASLRAGVVITHIDGVHLAGLTVDEVQSLLLGPEHALVELRCLPQLNAPSAVPNAAGSFGDIPRNNIRARSREFNSMLLNTTSAAKEMLTISSSFLLLPPLPPLPPPTPPTPRTLEGHELLFGSTHVATNEDGKSNGGAPHSTLCTDDAGAFLVHVLRSCANPSANPISAASGAEGALHHEIAKEAEEAACRVRALRGDNTSLQECVESLLRALAMQANAAGDAQKAARESWELTFGAGKQRSKLAFLASKPDFDEDEPAADDVGSVGASKFIETTGDGSIGDGGGGGGGGAGIAAIYWLGAGSAQVNRDMKVRRLVEAAQKTVHRHTFSKVLSIAPLERKYARALTFENFFHSHGRQHAHSLEELMQQFAAVVRLCEQSLHLQASQREELSTNTLALEQMQARLDAMTRELDEEQEARQRLAGLSTKQSKELSQLQQRCITLEKQVALLSDNLAAAQDTADEMAKREANAVSAEGACRKNLHMLNDKLMQLTVKASKSEIALQVTTKERNQLQASLKSGTVELQRRYKELEKTADSRARGWDACRENLERGKAKLVRLESENTRLNRELQRKRETIESQIEEIHTLRLHPVGIGIYLADKTLEIKQLVESAAAYASGQIRVGDFIVAIDGVEVGSKNIKIVREMLLGSPGSWVSLELKRWVEGEKVDCAYASSNRQDVRKSKKEIIQNSMDSERLIVTGSSVKRDLIVSKETCSPSIATACLCV
jgi:C-terminal processing protease CtpA/Prc